jgi:Glycosyltransferase family 9 (heptosyltransferase)
MVVGILHGYTCPQADEQLYQRLADRFGRQIQYVEPTAQPEHLLDTTAFIDQADLLITGDTGLMHLAATQKKIPQGETGGNHPRNNTAILTIWGGTRPGYWGYPALATIIGEGNKLQRQMYPGIRKYLWIQKKADYFGHIDPSALTNAILTSAPFVNVLKRE